MRQWPPASRSPCRPGDAGVDQHHRLARHRPGRHLGRGIDHLPGLRPDRDRRHQPTRASRAGSTTTSAPSARAVSTRTGRPSTWSPPGDLNWALCTPNLALYVACTNSTVGRQPRSSCRAGPAKSAPLTAGTAALVIQAYEQNHGGAAPTPAVVKQIIMSTANDIAAPADQQGAGLLDAYAAVQAAASYPGSTQVSGHALLDSTTQFNAVAPVDTARDVQ